MTQPTDPPATGQKTRRFIPLLRLVHPTPATEGASKPRRKGTFGPPVFTPEEEQLLRASLRSARTAFGSWRLLAAAMHVNPGTLESIVQGKRRGISAEIAVRLAKAVKVPLDALITPGLRPVKAPCPTCGRDGGA